MKKHILQIVFLIIISLTLSGCDFEYSGFKKFTDGCDAIETLNSNNLLLIPDSISEVPGNSNGNFIKQSSAQCATFYKSTSEGDAFMFISFKKLSDNILLGGIANSEQDDIFIHFLLNKMDGERLHILTRFPTKIMGEIESIIGKIPYEENKYKIDRIDQILGVAFAVRNKISQNDYQLGQLAPNNLNSKTPSDSYFKLAAAPKPEPELKSSDFPELSSEEINLKNNLLGTWECNASPNVAIRKDVKIKWMRVYRGDISLALITSQFLDGGDVIVHIARSENWRVEGNEVVTSNLQHHYISQMSGRELSEDRTLEVPDDLKKKMNDVMLDFFPMSKKERRKNVAFRDGKMIEQGQIECRRFPWDR